MTRLVTAHDLCLAMQTTLEKELPVLVDRLDLDLGTVSDWLHLPTLDAITAADYPVGAIISPGLAGEPNRKDRDRVDATWRIVVGVWDRGEDHTDTAHRIRTWGALVRAAVRRSPSLGGVASSSTWKGEEYDRVPAKNQARTLGATAVAFDVTAENVADVRELDEPAPVVRSTRSTITATSPRITIT